MDHKEGDFRKICFILLSEYEKVMQGIRQAVFGGWTCRERYI